MKNTVVLTCTRDRPACIQLLNKYLSRQTCKEFTWLIATDGETDFLPSWAEVVPFRSGAYRYGGRIVSGNKLGHSMLDNLVAGLRVAKDAAVLICEDDEWFAPTYVETALARLRESSFVGFAPSHYYHLPSRTYVNKHNVSFASLTASAWRPEVTPFVLDIALRGDPFVDSALWDQYSGTKQVFDNNRLNFSFKGMPGPTGIGQSHTQPYGGHDWNFAKLEEMIGKDADAYKTLLD